MNKLKIQKKVHEKRISLIDKIENPETQDMLRIEKAEWRKQLEFLDELKEDLEG